MVRLPHAGRHRLKRGESLACGRRPGLSREMGQVCHQGVQFVRVVGRERHLHAAVERCLVKVAGRVATLQAGNHAVTVRVGDRLAVHDHKRTDRRKQVLCR